MARTLALPLCCSTLNVVVGNVMEFLTFHCPLDASIWNIVPPIVWLPKSELPAPDQSTKNVGFPVSGSLEKLGVAMKLPLICCTLPTFMLRLSEW